MNDRSNSAAPPLPKCVSMILCDAAYQIGRSGRNIIVATFHELAVPHRGDQERLGFPQRKNTMMIRVKEE